MRSAFCSMQESHGMIAKKQSQILTKWNWIRQAINRFEK